MSFQANGHAGINGNGAGVKDAVAQIQEALQVVHGATSSNAARQEAFVFLENVKAEPEAPFTGATLAADPSQPPVIRHYALSLLEHAIRHKWATLSEDQTAALRGWILELASKVSEEDPLYLRNKTAQLWVLLAERSWLADWTDMDTLLVQLWDGPGGLVHKEFVLFVLEMLSEDIFTGEGTIAAMREGVLSKACVEIYTPASVLADSFPNRQQGPANSRCGDEGWLMRLGVLLDQLLNSDLQGNERNRTCAVKILTVYRSSLSWAVPKAIEATHCVQNLCNALAASHVSVQMAAVEALHVLYCRSQLTSSEFLSLVCPMFSTQVVTLLRQLFEWSIVDPQDIDDEKYLFAKKFSEMMSNLAHFVDQNPTLIPDDCDIPSFLALLLAIVRSPSFLVSIPILVSWTRLLRSNAIGGSDMMAPLIAPLLETCTSRMIRYESLPDDSEDPSMVFLMEDIDTIPERHAFLGNYRRYSVQVIEFIVRQQKADAIYHILSQVDQVLQHLYDGVAPFSIENYSKTSIPILRADAQCTVVEAALKGYMKWRATIGSKPQEHEQQRVQMENAFENWCERLLAANFEDPLIKRRMLQLAVAFSTSALDKNVGFMLKVLENILMIQTPLQPNYPAYSEAVKELQSDCVRELQRLATKMPDYLLDVYDQLEAKVNELSTGNLDTRLQISYQTFLFTIIHRAKRIDNDLRMQRLESFVRPVQMRWQDQELNEALSSFSTFVDLTGMNYVRDYLVSHRVHEVQDWSRLQLDAEGQALQAKLDECTRALPLRATRAFLGCSTEKIERGTPEFEISSALWRGAIPIILPGILKFLSYGHAFHSPANWTSLPDDMRGVVGRILTDRFWQAGISEGSKDEFYARVTGTKTTMEGLASSIRASIRVVRETCYSVLYCMSRMELDFYGFEELPGPLAEAMFTDARYLSSHQLNSLVNLVKYLVDDCPPQLRPHFIPPVLATFFTQIDAKLSSEWDAIAQKQVNSSANDDLKEEMKEESILRQLTYSTVMIAAGVLDPARFNPIPSVDPNNLDVATPKYPTIREFCITNLTVLEPLLVFLAHATRMRDTRCCGIVLRILRSLLPEFDGTTGAVETHPRIREFISNEVLVSCIYSLHEPYFVDLQKEIAQLIATTIIHYSSLTPTPRQILLNLPGMSEQAVDRCFDYLTRPAMQSRQQRALVLDLLRDVKGVSISEQGRIDQPAAPARRERSKMQQGFMKAPEPEPGKKAPSPDLEGVASMFDA